MTRDYHINVFYSQDDGGYIADIPDLDACSAFGDSPQSALKRCSRPRTRGSSRPASVASPPRRRGTGPRYTHDADRRRRPAERQTISSALSLARDLRKRGSALRPARDARFESSSTPPAI